MKKRGFTLTEVLGVIVILGMIALIIFPNVNRSIKSSKQKLYDQQIALIEENARKWGVEHTAELPDTGSYYLRLDDLVVGGYVTQKELKDPRDGSAMEGCIVISYDPSYNQYKYNYTEASCEDRPNDDTVPTLTVNDYVGAVGDNVALSTKYEATYGVGGGKTTCKYQETIITNVNYFSEEGTYAVKCIATGMNGKSSEEQTMNITLIKPMTGTELATKNNLPELAGGYRYQGGNPDNYVKFGSDMYRIIGVFNGQMKLIYWGPEAAVGQFYQNTNLKFDPNASEGGHGDYGYHDWAQAKLQTTLNTTYWNTIDTTYQAMVDQSHVWNIGALATYGSRSDFYNAERSSTKSSIMSSHLWTGKIGLMYPSDYGYATNGTSCDSDMNTWYSEGDGNSACYSVNNNWLVNTSYYQWTMTPSTTSNSTTNDRVFIIRRHGNIENGAANDQYKANPRVRPTLYLKSTVKIKGGVGTSSNPYILAS